MKSLSISLLLLVLSPAVISQTIQSQANGAWSNPSTWSSNQVPTASDDVEILGHTVHLDLTPTGGQPMSLCNHLTVSISGVLQLGYNGTAIDKQFVITGDINCNGTISGGRNVPGSGNSGEGLIYDNNSSFILSLLSDTTRISGSGYIHPEDIIISNETGSAKTLNIDNYNVVLDNDMLTEGNGHINLNFGKYAYLNLGGTLGIGGETFASSDPQASANIINEGIVFAENVNLFTANASNASSLTLAIEGVLSANTINGGTSVSAAAGGFNISMLNNSIFRVGAGAFNPEDIAISDANVTLTNNNGEIKIHYASELTSGTDVISQINNFDKTDTSQILPMREKLGGSHIAGWYNFTEENYLREGINRFKEWGSRNIKTTISANTNKMFNAYPFNSNWPTFNEPAEVIMSAEVDELFSDPYFDTHAFWSPAKGVNGFFSEGPDRNHDRYLDVERQLYNAAKVILQNYGDMGKTFLFQNWEGDWMLRGSVRNWEKRPDNVPDDIDWQVEGMARMWRAVMRGIERAIDEFPGATSKLQYAVEFNKLFYNQGGTRVTMMDLGIPSVVENVLPKVRMHLSSWSAYDGNFNEPATGRPFPTGMWNGVEIASYFTNGTKGLDGVPVQIGEIGINENPPYQTTSDAGIIDRYDKMVAMVSELGVQNFYLWNLYGSGEQNVVLEKGVQYSTDTLYQFLDGKWIIEPDNSFGVAGSLLKDDYFIRNNVPSIENPLNNLKLNEGFSTTQIDLSGIFSDADNDDLAFSIDVSDETVVTTSVLNDMLTIQEVGNGEAEITITVNDGNGGVTSVAFSIDVFEAITPTVFIGDTSYPDIDSALTAAVDGNVILVRGIHTESITIDKSVTVRGVDPNVDIIQAAATPGTASDRVVSIVRPDGNPVLTVTIENLGIRYGNTTDNGGGINVDKATGLVTLRNLRILDNSTTKNGGGVSMAGSNADIIACTIQNNTSTLDGGGLVVSPNNGAGIDSNIKILSSLIDSNMGRNGGGLYINGNNNFGNDHLIDVYIENTTISNNAATSASGGSGGGAIWSKGSTWTGDNTTGNASLTLVHATLYNNTHSGATKNGIRFTSAPAGSLTNFQLYNSIVVTGDDTSEKALNFTNSNTTDVVNSILGGLEGAGSFLTIIDDVAKNNSKTVTATSSGLITMLDDEIGSVAVLPLDSAGTAVDYATAPVSITLPTTDARELDRDSIPDAGAYEYMVPPNNPPMIVQAIENQTYESSFSGDIVDISEVFTDAENDSLTLTVIVADESVVTATLTSPFNLSITEVGPGETTISVTADDGNEGVVTDTFTVVVNPPVDPTVFIGQTSYASVTAALTAAVDSDVILVRGIHTESITIDKSVTIRGVDPNVDIIQAAATPGTASDRVVNIISLNASAVLTVTLENVGIKNGNTTANGGGINVDKATGLVLLKNLRILNNTTSTNGGGLNVLGSNMDIIDCTIQNNTSALDGGGLVVAPSNSAGIDNDIRILSSLIDNNMGRNGGGLYINGNNNFGNDHLIDVFIENTTVSNNAATSASGGAGGGAIWSKGSTWTGDNTTGNTSLTLVHATLYNNTHSGATKNGIRFTSAPASSLTNFQLYNSVVVTGDDVSEKALNLTNSNTTDVVNSILGGLEGASSFLTIIDDIAKNNSKTVTATSAGLITTLDDEIGPVAVLPLDSTGTAVDYATAPVSITLPTTDARGVNRDTTPDAGAYEIGTFVNDRVFIDDTGYPNIASALTAAADGDVILIRGIHTESITIDKSVTLRGEDPTVDIIQAAESAGTASDRVVNVVRPDGNPVLTVTIENLGIQNGNATENGGGINVDKVTGLLTLKNLIIANNATTKNGGGVSTAGSNADIIACTIQNNTSTLDGGGIIVSPNNGAGINNQINILSSLIDSNDGRNGGGLYINGNNNFGNDHLIDVYVENTTLSNNTATSASGGSGGGAIWSKGSTWTGDNTTGNTSLTLVHATLYNNTHSGATKNGIRFTSSPAGSLTNFQLYNSIVVTGDDTSEKALNFTNSNTTDVVNSILGGLEGASSFLTIIDDVAKNNSKTVTATSAGLITTLDDEIGLVAVLPLDSTGTAVDYATAPVSITLPTTDARGVNRDTTPDAGAYEVGAGQVFVGEAGYPNIASALTAALEGDTILVTGIHTESITIDKSVTLRGEDPTVDIIQAAESVGTASDRVVNVVRPDGNPVLTVTIENLGIQNGNTTENGGGLNVDKVTGLITLKNLIIANNATTKNGGGVSMAGSNADVIDCTIQNNTSTLDGGGIVVSPNNGAGIDNQVNILSSLIDSNDGRNGGGLYINGNNNFGNDHLIDVYIENTTVSNNIATSASGGVGGGGIWSKGSTWTGDNTTGNTSLTLVHATLYNNTHSGATKNGIRFTSAPAGSLTNFQLYNSIVVTGDNTNEKALNFTNSNTTDVVNSILGGLEGASSFLTIIDDVARNNSKAGTATFAGLTSPLNNDFGPVAVLPLDSAGTAVDYATAPVSITLPTTDARGVNRDATPDAGAYEIAEISNIVPTLVNPVDDLLLDVGFAAEDLDMTNTFSDADNDLLSLSVEVADETVVTAAFTSPFNLRITELGSGETTITVTADDGNDGIATSTMNVSVNTSTSDDKVFIGDTGYPDITSALTAAVDGDVILVMGVHTEPITINKSVTLRGEDPTVDIIQAAETSGTASNRVVNILQPDDNATLTVTIENLGIQNGSTTENGGGINADKVTGLLTLRNLIIANNATTKNGGGVSMAGSNADVINCTIQNNTSTLDGGGVVVAPSNGAGIDNDVRVLSSLIDSNMGRNGGGLYINGNNNFGNDHLIDVYIENTTLSNNAATSGSGAAGGGAIWSKGSTWTGDNTTGNASLTLVHTTLYNNTHSGAAKNGIRFTSAPAGSLTNFQLYNSIVVTGDDVGEKALNFTNSNTTDVLNSILGGLEGASSFLTIIDDAAKNNSKGRTATFAGLTSPLNSDFGPVAVLPLDSAGTAVDFCTAAVGVTLPTTDARGIDRDATPDAGAYEIAEIPNRVPVVANSLEDLLFVPGFVSEDVDMTDVFSDPDDDLLTLSAEVANESIVTAAFTGPFTLNIAEVGAGQTTITVTANDGNGGMVTDLFEVNVGTNTLPVVANDFSDLTLKSGFMTEDVDVTNTFSDADNDSLSFSVQVTDESVVTAAFTSPFNLRVTEVGLGATTIAVTADDGNGGSVTDEFEVVVNANSAPIVINPVSDLILDPGFATEDVDMTNTFTDADNDPLTLSAEVADESVVTAAFTSPFSLRITEVGSGETTITVTADDGNDGIITSTFDIIINTPTSDDRVFIGDVGYPSISTALLAAVDGDVILVMGVHTESITVDKSVTLRGEDPTVDIIQAAESSGTASDRVVNIVRPDDNPVLTVTIENLGIQNGNAPENGGGINIDKVTGLVTLRNLIITDNATEKNGGGVSMAGSNADIIDCTIQNNTSTLDGGGVIMAPNNGAGIDNQINILSSLIDSNAGRNGGGLYINGNNNFGNDHLIGVYIENTTLSNNTATSGTSAAGGGAIWSKGSTWTGNNTTGNASLTLVHATLYNNTHSGSAKNGIRFTSAPAGSLTNFRLYNSIVVTADDVSEKALNFTNSNTTDVVNSILGGLEGASSFLSIIDDAAKNNSKGRTATFAGLTSPLSNDFGPVAVLSLDSAGTAVDFCTATVGVTLPITDARGLARDATPDAGAYEIAKIPNRAPVVVSMLNDEIYEAGFGTESIDLSDVFQDADNDMLSYSVNVLNTQIVTAIIQDESVIITEVGLGTTDVEVTADDGNGGGVTDVFKVTVSPNLFPIVANPIGDQILNPGFMTQNVDLMNTFTDADNDPLTLSVAVADESIVTAAFTSPFNLTITEVGLGETTVTVTADDGNGGVVPETFIVSVGGDGVPVVVNPIGDITLNTGFLITTIDISETFDDADNDDLTFSVLLQYDSVVDATVEGDFIIVKESSFGLTECTVTAMDSDGNSVSDVFIINIDLVLSVESEIPDFLFYPNPVTNDFRINAGDAEGTIRILSFEGKVLRQYQYVPTASYEVWDMEKGVYLMQFIQDNKATKTVKFVIR